MAVSLIDTNPYLSDPAVRRRGLLRSVATSSAIEGIRAPFKRTSPGKKSAAGRVKRANAGKRAKSGRSRV